MQNITAHQAQAALEFVKRSFRFRPPGTQAAKTVEALEVVVADYSQASKFRSLVEDEKRKVAEERAHIQEMAREQEQRERALDQARKEEASKKK